MTTNIRMGAENVGSDFEVFVSVHTVSIICIFV